ncbi:MAG: GNAT family N-acetyltransferase [Candidatus Zixiibacteriota bacterium]|nr:MAG: GNAT family N-acetyltransferase [candidate division Zixibacteria bacterium]
MSGPAHPKADIVPFTQQYSQTVRGWLDSKETLYDVCRGKEYPPANDIVDNWQRKDVNSYLLMSAGKPVAYAELWNRPNEMAVEIAHLVVDPTKRGEGFGTRMVQLLYEQGSARNDVAKVIINLYNENSVALSCFLKAGFELVGTTTHTQGLRILRMVR